MRGGFLMGYPIARKKPHPQKSRHKKSQDSKKIHNPWDKNPQMLKNPIPRIKIPRLKKSQIPRIKIPNPWDKNPESPGFSGIAWNEKFRGSIKNPNPKPPLFQNDWDFSNIRNFRLSMKFRLPMDLFQLLELSPIEYLVAYGEILPRKERTYKMVTIIFSRYNDIKPCQNDIFSFGTIGKQENEFLPRILHFECHLKTYQQLYQDKFFISLKPW